MATYDPKIIDKMADRIYSEAASLILTHTIGGGLVGFGLGYAVVYFGPLLIAALRFEGNGMVPIVGAVMGLVVGWSSGSSAALRLKFEAQRALVLVAIEQNTRR